MKRIPPDHEQINEKPLWSSECDFGWHDGEIGTLGLRVLLSDGKSFGYVCLRCAGEALAEGMSKESIITQIEEMIGDSKKANEEMRLKKKKEKSK